MSTAVAPNLTLADLYDEDLFTVLGVQDSSDEEKGALLIQMVTVIQGRVFDRIFDQLSKELQDEYLHLMESEDVDGMEKFLEKQVPDYGSMFEEEGRKLRRALISKLVA